MAVNNKAKKAKRVQKPEQHSWLKRLSIGGEVFSINFTIKKRPIKEANKSLLFKRRKEIRKGLSYGMQAFTAVVLLTVVVSMLSWSALIWNKSVQNRYRPIQLLRSTLGSFGQLAIDTIAGQNEANASSTAPSIFSLISQGVKKEFKSLASGVKKQISSMGGSSNNNAKPPKPPASPPSAPAKPIEAISAPIARPVPVAAAVATTTTAATTTVVKKADPVKLPVATTTVPTTTPAKTVPATTTPPAITPPPAENPQTVIQYVYSQVPAVEYPDTFISGSPDSITSSTAAHFAYSSSKTVVVYSYSLDNGGWISTGASTALSGLAEGNHVFKIRSIDSSGPDQTPAQFDWRIDLTSPTVSFLAAPSDFTNKTSSSFSFSADELATYYYKLDDGNWQQAATSSATVSGLSEGAHRMQVYGVDSVGLQGAPVAADWRVDLLPPSVTLNNLAPTTDLTAFGASGLTVSFGGSDQMPNGSSIAGYDVEYAIGGGEWQLWNQMLEQDFAIYGQPMNEGQIAAFRARAYDAAGNVSSWSASKHTRFADTRPSHVVISEVQISGSTDTDEFIELYNPTPQAIILSTSGYRLSYKDSGGAEHELLNDFMDIQIDAYSYLLVAHDGYDGVAVPDIRYSSSDSVPMNATIVLKEFGQVVDRVGFGSAADYELAPFASNPGNHESLERKAMSTSTSGTMVTGAAHGSLGNGYDSNDNAEDFVSRVQPDPQNVDSGFESLSYGNGSGLKLAMAEAALMLRNAWFGLVKNWINPARIKSIDGFIYDTVKSLASQVFALDSGKESLVSKAG